jgi:hypothetical protein
MGRGESVKKGAGRGMGSSYKAMEVSDCHRKCKATMIESPAPAGYGQEDAGVSAGCIWAL